MKRIGRLFLLVPLILLLLVACDLLPRTPAGDEASPSAPITPTPTTAVVATVAPIPTAAASLSPLRLWLPAEIGARTPEGAQELADQLQAFQAGPVSSEVVLEQKPVEGAGGILSYLRTGGPVAPSILPDLVALPTSAIADAGVRQLLVPLDGLVDPAAMADAYSGALAQVVTEDRLYGVPFVAVGLPHLVYARPAITGTVPLDWTTFISTTNNTLVLPADSRDGAIFGLQFYLAEGGTLVNEDGQPDLQAAPLARALRQIAQRPENLLQSRQLKTLDEAWQYYQVSPNGFLWVRADYYLGRRAEASAAPDNAYSRVPGPGGPLTPLTTTWAWAITTPDPARQRLAAELIQALAAPEALAAWSQRSQLLPARREAMALLAQEDDYFQFADRELERAQAMPISESSRLLAAIGDAVFQVLTTDASPEAIAEQTVLSLRQ